MRVPWKLLPLFLILPLLLGFLSGNSVRAERQPESSYRWPAGPMRVYSASEIYTNALQQTAREWNSLGHPVVIDPVQRRKAADVVIADLSGREMQKVCRSACAGKASQIGWKEGESFVVLWDALPGGLLARRALLMHEISHLLGIFHKEQKCALMHPSFQPRCGKRLFHISDIRSIKRTYPEWTPPKNLPLRPNEAP